VKLKTYCLIVMLLIFTLITVSCGTDKTKAPTSNKSEVVEEKPTKEKSSYPEKAIKWIIPFPAGSANDLFTRPLAESLANELGTTVICENISGGGGSVAMSSLFAQPTDGYTLCSYTSTMAFHMAEGIVPFGVDDLIYIARVGGDPYALAVAPEGKFNTVDDLVKYAKENPGKLTVGGPGARTAPQFNFDIFCELADIEATWVPYEGGNNACVALMGGNIDAVMVTNANVVGLNESGQVKILALSQPERSKFLKDIPVFRELGYDYDYVLSRGVVTRTGTPAEHVKILEAALAKAVKDPKWIEYLNTLKQDEWFIGQDKFAESVIKEVEEIKRIYIK